jgi:hypothetical protein
MASYTTLRRGSTGDEVKKLQKALGITADGIYGKDTEAAVKKHQKANGLTIDGIAGKNTLGSLYTTKPAKTTKTTKTNTGTPKNETPTFKGVDQKYVDVAYQEYKPSEQETKYLDERNKYGQMYEDKVSQGVQLPESVKQAFAWLEGQQEYFKNGKTSWDDKIMSQIGAIENREKFEYDVDNDQLFQQALASAMNSGKTAMQDTIGQASSLTGGYGSTYATSAGNQAYNSFIEDAYNNLPEYYQMALSAYQAEGDEMYRLLGMYTQMGETEWNRNVDSYNLMSDYANSERDFAYRSHQDDIANTYNVMNMYDGFYKQENAEGLTMWQQKIDNAWKTIGQQSSDYWSQTNFDEGVRQFDQTFNATYTSDGNGGYVKKGTGGGGLKNDKFSLSATEVQQLEDAYKNAGGGEKGENAVLDILEAAGKMPNTEAAQKVIDNIIAGVNNEEAQNKKWYEQDWVIDKDTNNGWWIFGKGEDHNDTFKVNGSEETYTYDDLKDMINNEDLSDYEKQKFLKKLQNQSKK